MNPGILFIEVNACQRGEANAIERFLFLIFPLRRGQVTSCSTSWEDTSVGQQADRTEGKAYARVFIVTGSS